MSSAVDIALARTALFIDGAHLLFATKALGFDIDFERLLDEARRDRLLVRAYFYAVVFDKQDSPSVRPLLDWLTYNGFTVKAKTSREQSDPTAARAARRSLEIQLAVDAMELSKRIDEIVIFSGNGDLRALIAAIQRRGVHVTVVSTVSTTPALVADELRRQADRFVDLIDLRPMIARVATRQTQRPHAPHDPPRENRPGSPLPS